jgi:hypothetical protein
MEPNPPDSTDPTTAVRMRHALATGMVNVALVPLILMGLVVVLLRTHMYRSDAVLGSCLGGLAAIVTISLHPFLPEDWGQRLGRRHRYRSADNLALERAVRSLRSLPTDVVVGIFIMGLWFVCGGGDVTNPVTWTPVRVLPDVPASGFFGLIALYPLLVIVDWLVVWRRLAADV